VKRDVQKRHSGRTLVLGGGVGILALLAMAYAGFGGFGRRRFAQGSLITEAHFNVALLARGIAACAEGSDTHISQKRALPESTAFVPAATDALRNGYVSTAKDWESHAFNTAGRQPGRDAVAPKLRET
jgi:hypothetical protein